MAGHPLDVTIPLPLSLLQSDPERGDEPSSPPSGSDAGRYQFRTAFARSLMSEVGYGWDTLLERDIVWKAPLSASGPLLHAFYSETRISARLNHPHILAIHDLIPLEDGRPVAILPRVDGVNLETVLTPGYDASPQPPGRLMLLMLFQQVCLAIEHAHQQGIVHCDIKPANILYRPPGQAYVADWGLAEDLRAPRPGPRQEGAGSPQGAASPPRGRGDSERSAATLPRGDGDSPRPTEISEREGASPREDAGPVQEDAAPPRRARGTLSYAAPEQLRGTRPTPAVDIHGLGALLYHLLTGVPPWSPRPDEDVQHFLARRLRDRLLRPREQAPSREIPIDLDALCISCLQDRPEDRPPSALAVHDAIAAYLEGLKLGTHRRSAALAIMARAEQSRLQLEQLRAQLEEVRRARQARAATLDVFSARHDKQALWALEDRQDALARDHHNRFLEVTNLIHQAIELDPELAEARRALVSLYLERLDQLEQQGNATEQPLLEALIQRYDDGTFSSRLTAKAHVTVSGEPGSVVWRYRVIEEARILRPVEETRIGAVPQTLALEPGRWLLVVRGEDRIEARYPLRLRRGQQLGLHARLPTPAEIGPEYLFIPAGVAWLGGDPEAFVEETLEVYLADFAIARHPVTCAEYLDFLNALARNDPTVAARHAPRMPDGTLRWPRNPDGTFYLTGIDPEGDPISPLDPVHLVNAYDAEAYCAWRATIEGRPIRLPTAAEWEKAARGGDGRFFPWGDRFEASFCNNRQARPGKPRPQPVGTFPEDTSPYGVMEMAGGMSEMTAGAGHGPRRICGGAWYLYGRQCRLARRVDLAPDHVTPSVGFRVCHSL
jgi:serine/threonine-protein kinase